MPKSIKMRNSIFTKYFLICTAVILISFLCLGAVLLLVSSQYFVSEKKDDLISAVNSVSADAQEAAAGKPVAWKYEITPILNDYSISSACQLFMTNDAGKVVYKSDNMRWLDQNSYLRGEFSTGIDRNGDYLRSDLGVFSTQQHVFRKEVEIANSIYYIFGASSISEQTEYLTDIMQLFGVSALVVVIFVLIAVFLIVRHVTRPVRRLSAAAKKYAAGDYSKKIGDFYITEFDEVSHALNEMAVSASNMDYMRKSFIANVSHELRTPMTSIGGFVDGMLDGTIPQSEHKKYFRIISDEVHRLTRLVRSMLNLSKMEAGEMSPEYSEFSIIEPIVETLVTFEGRLEEKNIEVKGLDAGRVIVYADIDLIHQVVYNLIENAVKFVNENGTIEFSFRHKNDVTYVSIKNTGEGISDEELPMIFDRFYKVDQSRGIDAKGLGLGLNIVKTIANLHNISITVESKVSEYTKFTLALPDKSSGEAK